jgi:hypothetical protein
VFDESSVGVDVQDVYGVARRFHSLACADDLMTDNAALRLERDGTSISARNCLRARQSAHRTTISESLERNVTLYKRLQRVGDITVPEGTANGALRNHALSVNVN